MQRKRDSTLLNLEDEAVAKRKKLTEGGVTEEFVPNDNLKNRISVFLPQLSAANEKLKTDTISADPIELFHDEDEESDDEGYDEHEEVEEEEEDALTESSDEDFSDEEEEEEEEDDESDGEEEDIITIGGFGSNSTPDILSFPPANIDSGSLSEETPDSLEESPLVEMTLHMVPADLKDAFPHSTDSKENSFQFETEELSWLSETQ